MELNRFIVDLMYWGFKMDGNELKYSVANYIWDEGIKDLL